MGTFFFGFSLSAKIPENRNEGRSSFAFFVLLFKKKDGEARRRQGYGGQA